MLLRFASSMLMILLLIESLCNSQQFLHNGLDHSIDDGSNGGVESSNDIASGADVDETKNAEESQSVDGAEDEVQNGAGEGSSGSVHGKRDSECCFVSHHQC